MVRCTVNPDIQERVAGEKKIGVSGINQGKVTLTILEIGQGRTAEGNRKE